MLRSNISADIAVPCARLVLAAALIAIPAMNPAGAIAGERETPEPALASASALSGSALDPAMWDAAGLGDLDPRVFSTALEAAASAVGRGQVDLPSTLTVIDFSRPSTRKRLWVFDVRSHALLFDELVSHGRGSGKAMATSFSNVPDSNKSSLGLFRAGEAYIGKHGLSLRLDGLEPGVNDRARQRAIVVHGASYVSAAVARVQGYLGRSLGCPAVRPEIARPLIEAIKDGGLLYAYGDR